MEYIGDLQGVNVDYIRKLNMRIVLEMIKQQGPISRAGLSRNLNLSPPTISSLVQSLKRVGLVVDADEVIPNRGRPPQLVQYNEHAGYVLGMEVKTTSIRVALATLQGHMIDSLEEPHDRYIGAAASFDQCQKAIKNLIGNHQIPQSEILALSIAVPGIINSKTNEVIFAKNLMNWHDIPLGKLFNETLKMPVTVENDFRCGAIGEFAYGAAKGYKSFVFLGLCEGVGSAIMIEGNLMRGHHFLSGEIGYMSTRLVYEDGTAHDRDYLENHIGIGRIREILLESRSRGKRSALLQNNLVPDQTITIEAILHHAAQKDDLAMEIFRHVTRGLAFAIANIAVVCDPPLVVLCLNNSDQGKSLLTSIQNQLKDQIPFQPELVLSTLGQDGILAGAIYRATQIAEEGLLADIA